MNQCSLIELLGQASGSVTSVMSVGPRKDCVPIAQDHTSVGDAKPQAPPHNGLIARRVSEYVRFLGQTAQTSF